MRFKNEVKKTIDEALPPVAVSNQLAANFASTSFWDDAHLLNINNNNHSGSSGHSQHLHHGAVKESIKVSNVCTGKIAKDTLHKRGKQIGCTTHYCVGSLMTPNKAKTSKIKAEILEEAFDFFEQYFIYLKKDNSDELSKRLAEVTKELEQTATYTLTTDELCFGAKTAWRNNARCIGRMHWNQLQIQDARHVRTTEEMFKAICKHIEISTNGGNIQPLITVFPQRVPGREDFRVWNPQLIGFAGYVQENGDVVGDRGRIQFTKVCQKLGWKGSGGPFDLLPIVLSAPGEEAKFYDLPKQLIKLIEIEHPHFEWFKELGLKWYAVPAVSDMLLDVGGLEFSAAPFNGWYMGTEIGARDFCDPQRYDLLEKIGQKMGLNTSLYSNLWKDKVLFEVNLAVLHSYHKSYVTIVDHHTASENFLRHLDQEQRQRGGCPADWVWIVPPMSGSVTGVFHQEMLNYSLKPSFEYQEKAWSTYQWVQSTIELKYSFKTVARVAMYSSILMGQILRKRVKATLLYATETGKSEKFAHKLSKIMQRNFYVKLQCMDSYRIEWLKQETLLIVITSTFGNGESPENGREFWRELYNLKHNKLINLSSLKYSVFALGSSQYPTFCAFGKNVDKALGDLGAKRLIDVGIGDELQGQDQAFEAWIKKIYKESCCSFSLKYDEQSECEFELTENENYNPENVRLKEIAMDEIDCEQQIVAQLSRLHKKKIFLCSVTERKRLKPQKSESQTLFVKMTPTNSLAKSFLVYEPGDHIGVFPRNPPHLVDAVLCRVRREGYFETESIVYQIEIKFDDEWIQHPVIPPCTLKIAFTNYLDIASVPSQKFLGYLAGMANDRWDSFRLRKLAQDADYYKKWRLFHYPTLVDVLNEFPSVHVNPEFLLTKLPLLQPRYYSISSSQTLFSNEVHLTMSLVSYHISKENGTTRFGVCTGFFERFPSEPIACFLRSAPDFRLPDNNRIPIILIAAGSGIAPFRSFWQERYTQFKNGNKCGKMILFFGCRRSRVDNIYAEELNEMINSQVIHEVFLATSREPGQKKKYVQDEVYVQRSLVYWLLVNENAHIYVCGDVSMADGVKKSIVRVIETEGKMSETNAQEELEKLINERRYHEDVFGAIHRDNFDVVS
ncbi:nitric oxide synthase: inducible-like protein [Dinothrombium tinctorium]|uniref:Nitric oxide synthase n=1 Tax=Dinothrombium tinctorium TaxID=1965070 RepID=A0A3S3PG93_9ACAR|nr:nitric oxide synthase: inducible-like protein [Dinothrombium tinctorium]